MNIFVELSILLAVTTAIAIGVKLLKQPLVVGYILSGIIAGPSVLNVLQSQHELELFSKIGIVILLFIVGLHLNPKIIKEVGSVSLITGIGQVVFTCVIGFFIALLLGLDHTAALYVAIALTFSSTIIILKLLADKKDLQKLYAKIAVGFLLVQDIIATIVLIGITVTTNETSSAPEYVITLILLKGLGIILAQYLISTFVMPQLTRFVAQSQELLFLFALAWGTTVASIFYVLGFSIEIGALIAGVTLSVTDYAEEIVSRLKPLRDFFIVIFFILLGSQMIFTNVSQIVIPAIFLSLFVLIGNPIIVIILMNIAGYKRKTGFMAGLTVAQISEFSLILASLGLRVGHISQEVLSLITMVGLITIAGSTYLILYSDKIYPKLHVALRVLELVKRSASERGSVEENYTSLLFGFDRVGVTFLSTLNEFKEDTLVVDFNPKSIERLTDMDVPFRFGDASDIEFLEDLPTIKPKLVISTIPDVLTNSLIIKTMLAKNAKAHVIVLAHTVDDAQTLYDLGAAYVIMPHHLGADFAASLIRKFGDDRVGLAEEREKHQRKISSKYSHALK
ncbi:MAG: cation:proton antiporter [Microgenomates group bacterium]